MQNNYLLWTSRVEVIDDFIDDESIIQQLKKESIISSVISGQDHENMTYAQQQVMTRTKMAVMNYCVESGIDYNILSLNDLQKGCLYPYDENMVANHLYEPHHDIAEGGYVTAIYYIDSAWTENKWVGGELCIYKHLTFADYPENTINISPKQNRLIIFPGFLVHRVKPYFGDIPRTSLVMGWRVDEPSNKTVLIV